jgi:hypothetical protein
VSWCTAQMQCQTALREWFDASPRDRVEATPPTARTWIASRRRFATSDGCRADAAWTATRRECPPSVSRNSGESAMRSSARRTSAVHAEPRICYCVMFTVPFQSTMSKSDLHRLTSVLGLTTHMHPKLDPSPASAGVSRWTSSPAPSFSVATDRELATRGPHVGRAGAGDRAAGAWSPLTRHAWRIRAFRCCRACGRWVLRGSRSAPRRRARATAADDRGP